MMRRVACVIPLALIACAPIAAAAEGAQWQEYAYPADGFAVAMPERPSERTQTVANAPGGPVEAHFYTADIDDGTSYVVVANNRHPNDTRSPAQTLAAAKNGFAQAQSAKIESETPVSYGTDPGIDLRFATETFHGEARYYATGNRLYQLYAISPVNAPLPAGTDRFNRSFRLVASAKDGK